MYAQNENRIIRIPVSTGTVTVNQKTLQDEPAIEFYEEIDSLTQLNYPTDDCTDNNQNKAGIPVYVNTNFGANNMGATNPPDNAMAISNGGFIVSADNNRVDYYNDNGDTIVQYVQEYTDFYSLSGFTLDNVFDPRVIYDRYADRFILVTIDHRKDTTSCLYVSFSKNNTPQDSASWNHYKLPIDSTHYDLDKVFWYDYINIAINKYELYITSNVYEYFATTDNSSFVGNALWRIEKQNGYDSLTLNCKTNADILRHNSTKKAYTLVPLSESLQSESYNKGCLLVSNTSYVPSDSIFWYHLTGNISDTNTVINSNYIITTDYQSIPYASQPGGQVGDRIKGGQTKVQSGFYQNGKIHFVYQRSNASWSQIVYSRIDTATNTENRKVWGLVDYNYMYPTIASFSNDTITEDVMIAFQRVDPTHYIQLCVINYQGSWSPNTTVIKDGVGLLDRIDYLGTPETYERIGDYISIQRRYNQRACWVAGSFAYGDTTDMSDTIYNGLTTWIAEIGDTDVGIQELNQNKNFTIYPNPIRGNSTLYFKPTLEDNVKTIKMFDLNGRIILSEIDVKNNYIQIPNVEKGIYLITILTKNNNYETHKIFVH